MIGETRTEVLARIGANWSDDQRELSRRVVALFFQQALGDDDGELLNAEDQRAMLAVIHDQKNRIAVEAGFDSIEAMEAAQ